MSMLCSDVRERFATRGAVESFVMGREHIARLRKILSAIVDDERATVLASFKHGVLHRTADAVFALYLARSPGPFREALVASDIPKIAAEILGTNQVTLWADELHFKAAGDDSYVTEWHHDASVFPIAGQDIVSAWMPLMDIDFDNSPLQTIAGTHRKTDTRYRPPNRPSDAPLPEHFSEAPDWAETLAAGALLETWETRAGHAVFFGAHTVHGAPRNAGRSPRAVYVSRWVGPDVHWAANSMSRLDEAARQSFHANGRLSGEQFPTFRF